MIGFTATPSRVTSIVSIAGLTVTGHATVTSMVPLPEDCALNTIDTGVVSPAVTTTSLALPTATVSPPLSLPSTLMSHVPTSRSIVGFESVVTTGALPTGPLKLMRYEATVTVGRIVLDPPPVPNSSSTRPVDGLLSAQLVRMARRPIP